MQAPISYYQVHSRLIAARNVTCYVHALTKGTSFANDFSVVDVSTALLNRVSYLRLTDEEQRTVTQSFEKPRTGSSTNPGRYVKDVKLLIPVFGKRLAVGMPKATAEDVNNFDKLLDASLGESVNAPEYSAAKKVIQQTTSRSCGTQAALFATQTRNLYALSVYFRSTPEDQRRLERANALERDDAIALNDEPKASTYAKFLDGDRLLIPTGNPTTKGQSADLGPTEYFELGSMMQSAILSKLDPNLGAMYAEVVRFNSTT